MSRKTDEVFEKKLSRVRRDAFLPLAFMQLRKSHWNTRKTVKVLTLYRSSENTFYLNENSNFISMLENNFK